MTVKEIAELLDLIADRAPALRERGLRRLELGAGVAFVLAPPESEAAPAAAPPGDEEPTPDAIRDPWTYGTPQPGDPKRIPRRARTPLVAPGSESDR